MSNSAHLSQAQIEQFIEQGYVTLSGLIDPAVARSCCARLMDNLGFSLTNAATWPVERKSSKGFEDDEGATKPVFVPALNEPIAQLVGPHFRLPGGSGAILTFPEPGERHFVSQGPHIDGINTDHMFMWPQFRYLVGLIYLTDAPSFGGCLSVLPGSHRQVFEAWYQGQIDPIAGWAEHQQYMPVLPFAEPIPVPGKAGDVILLHYLLVHASSNNYNDHVRVALNEPVLIDDSHPYQQKHGAPQADWTPLDHTLRTDNLS